jgi:hypothetical protein
MKIAVDSGTILDGQRRIMEQMDVLEGPCG